MLNILCRSESIFGTSLGNSITILGKIISESKFLVIGGAGTIGQAVTKEIFKRNPIKLHVVDISENNLVELVRDIRSSFGYIDGDFQTYALDIGSLEYDFFIDQDGDYDYVLNLSALKHVRSEKDTFTLMRMIDVNILNTEKTIQQSITKNVKKYFCVSTDKAANPVNMMGASKRIMEMFLMKYSAQICISTARFANVAFSDGSLLHGFNQRVSKRQPIVAPNDVKRYFVSPQESGELCLMSCIFGENRDVFFPKLSDDLHLLSFADIAIKFLDNIGYKPYYCHDENEARQDFEKINKNGYWPCLITKSDTSGEKEVEEFYRNDEMLDLNSFDDIGVIKNDYSDHIYKVELFRNEVLGLRHAKKWSKENLVDLFNRTLPEFQHKETGKYLDSKM